MEHSILTVTAKGGHNEINDFKRTHPVFVKKTEKHTHFLGISSVRTVFTFAMPGVKTNKVLIMSYLVTKVVIL